MTSVQSHGCPRQKRLSVALSITLLDFSPPPKSGDELFDQPAGSSGAKPLANTPAAVTSVPKYSEDDLQQILKAVLEAWAPISTLVPAPVPAFVVSKVPREKLKARFPDVYYEKSHMDYYNFCQQCEDYFATARAMGPTQILFAMSFLWDQISFRKQ